VPDIRSKLLNRFTPKRGKIPLSVIHPAIVSPETGELQVFRLPCEAGTSIIRPMKIDVKKVAKLSNLTLSPDEEVEFDKQLNDIIVYIEQLNSVDTSNTKATAQVTGLVNRTRNDNFTDDMLSVEEALSGTAKTHNNMFVVDKLVDTT